MDKIDIVYLWVDGNDPKWQSKRARVLEEKGMNPNPQALHKGRFIDNEELRYSLRSVEMYAPWVHKIYIITDDQVPEWLNVDHPKIEVVSHKDILPKECLPTFNSHALELALTNIDGLSEKFLYANDDMFFARPVSPKFFYTSQGLPVARFARRVKFVATSLYSVVVQRARDMIRERYGVYYQRNPHHNIDAYLKSDVEACIAEFREDAERTCQQQFRTTEDLQRIVYLYWALANGRAKEKVVRHYGAADSLRELVGCLLQGRYCVDSRSFSLHGRNVEKKIAKYNPALMCLNDTEDATDNCRNSMKNYLEKRFPQKSGFEK